MSLVDHDPWDLFDAKPVGSGTTFIKFNPAAYGQVNNTYGYTAADEALVQIFDRLRAAAGRGTLVNFRGDSFFVLTDTPEEAERLVTEMEIVQVDTSAGRFEVRLRHGMATASADDSLGEVVRAAELAFYNAYRQEQA